MITRTSLPRGYAPYEELTFCSNMLRGVIPIVLGDAVPILIGKGDVPQVWLQAPTDKTGAKWIDLVVASVASHPAVIVSSNGKQLLVSVGGKSVARVKASSADAANLDLLDLRPLGLDLYGDGTSLKAAGAVLSRNTFQGSGAMLALDAGS